MTFVCLIISTSDAVGPKRERTNCPSLPEYVYSQIHLTTTRTTETTSTAQLPMSFQSPHEMRLYQKRKTILIREAANQHRSILNPAYSSQ